jgi:7-carboxy-7-deazaguanine synthase
MENSVSLIENFVSWQGEGPDSGRRMIILRFKTCNKKCPWCDTSVKMRITPEASHNLKDIQNQIYSTQAGLMITGGEPTVEKHFDEAVLLLNELIYPIANVESNGYNLYELIKSVKKQNVNYIFSPKIFNVTDYDFAIKTTSQLVNNRNVSFKIVYDGSSIINDYLQELSTILSIQSASPFMSSEKVWIMPEGTTREELIKNSEKVFDICEKYNFNFSSRNHIIFGFI